VFSACGSFSASMPRARGRDDAARIARSCMDPPARRRSSARGGRSGSTRFSRSCG
jgi:hypothetical protein